MRTLPTLLLALALAACGSGADYQSWDQYNLAGPSSASGPREEAAYRTDSLVMAEQSAPERGRMSRGGATGDFAVASPAMQPAPAPPADGFAAPEPVVASNGEVPSLERDAARTLPLLIYTGDITLAIYDVDATKQAVIDLAERVGGYPAQRSDYAVVVRIPAERFRATMDEIATLGDVLSTNWNAQDVTDQFTDLEIRLANALRMRERLQALLEEAQTVTDALAIERELERVTLEIERLEGQRRQMIDRIAFATITVFFSEIPVSEVPGEEYRLPFQWLNELGVERLLSL